jgi:hypothetical protein
MPQRRISAEWEKAGNILRLLTKAAYTSPTACSFLPSFEPCPKNEAGNL